MRIQKIFVAVLAGNNWANTSIVELAHHLPYYTADEELPFAFAFWVESGVRGQELARNRICKRFLDSKADVLLMIDNDMVLSSWNSLKVLETKDYDIAAPLQLMFDAGIDEKKGIVNPCIKPCAFLYDKEAQGHRQVFPGPGIDEQEVDAVGGGMLAIQRHVLENTLMVLEPGLDPPAYFRTVMEANYQRVRGNDIDFCMRARELGYKVKINWSAKTGHLKQNDLYQLEVYAKNQFILGYDTGRKHEDSMVEEEGGESGGRRGGLRSVGQHDTGVAGRGLDRSAKRRQERAKGKEEASRGQVSQVRP